METARDTLTRSLAWAPASGTGLEVTTVTMDASGCVAVGHITRTDPHPFDVYYRVEVDELWRTRYVCVSETLSSRCVEMRSRGDGRWTSDDGRLLRHLDAAIDVDISATPFSNTLPVRRLGIGVGESADIVTAYVDVPAMTATADPQRYTRLLPDVYRYQSLDSDFTRDVVVDEFGFVLEYPGLFSRVPATVEPA
ncbi:putative glycolipid-binding domain-containing protein [Herbiconiux sp. P16]|uniref:putative glycolipid-binding domain-containing protein n=1 Tax=Herbiconiux wuyangfengii TaxID=3342794 RepID=UPI0035B6DEB2